MKAQLDQAIEITLKPSMLLLGLLLSIAIVSTIILATLLIPYWIKLFLIALVVFSTLYYILRDCLLLLPWSWQRIEVNRFGELRLTNQEGQAFRPNVHATSFVHPQLVVLNFEQTLPQKSAFNKLPSLTVLSEVTGIEQHRQLRVWLRWWQQVKN